MLRHRLMLICALVAVGAPSAAPGPRSPLVRGPVSALMLTEDDLPAAFAISKKMPTGESEMMAAFLRPEVVMDKTSENGALMSVKSHVALLPGIAEAEVRFVGRSSLTIAAIEQELRAAGATSMRVREMEHGTGPADTVAGFRSTYVLQGIPHSEIRFRVLARNVVANLVVTSRSNMDGTEPEDLVGQAEDLLSKQLAKILGSAPARP